MSAGFEGKMCLLHVFQSISDIPLMLAAKSSDPNMVSIPNSKPLWFVSEEVGLDSESELEE